MMTKDEAVKILREAIGQLCDYDCRDGWERTGKMDHCGHPDQEKAINTLLALIPNEDNPFEQVCTRPKHETSPCNGLPRPDCPGYKEYLENFNNSPYNRKV